MKDALSSFDIAALTAELEHTIVGSRINSIYQINPKTLLLKLRDPKGTYAHLLVEAGRRMHMTVYAFGKPPKPPAFCMVLRKYLENGRIEGFSQYDFERIVEMKVRNHGEEYRLIIELFGEGNIILVGPENRILHALTYRRMRDRNILRGETFEYPPSRGKDPRNLRREDLSEIKGLGRLEVVKALTRILGIGGLHAEEFLLRADIEKNVPCSSLSEKDLDAVFSSLKELLSEVEGGKQKPCVFLDEEGEYVDAAPSQLKRYAGFECKGYRSFNEALDEYYAKVSAGKRVSEAREPIEQQIAELERILHDQERNLEELKRKAGESSKFGDIIYRNLSGIDPLIRRAMEEKRSGKSWQEIAERLEREKAESRYPAVLFQSLKPEALSIHLLVEGQPLSLNLKQSAHENAALCYEAAKKAKKKVEGLEDAIRQSREKIEQAKLQMATKTEETSESQERIKKREWYEKFRWFHSSDGLLVIGGRDASTNETLIKKHMEPQDIVFHADVVGAPFVLIKTQGETPTEQSLKEAAQFAGSYSRAWKEALAAIDVYWISPPQVSQSPPSGQYLPRGSFMIYGTKNYVKNVPLEVAIGIKKQKEQLRVIGGPPDAIAKQTSLYVRIAPGRESSGKLAKQIRAILAKRASDDDRRRVSKIGLEEIQRFIPAGLGAIR